MAPVKTDAEKIVAILHDVVEDSQPPEHWGFEELRREGFSQEILTALECMTKRAGENYEDFIVRSFANPIARTVKISDFEDNMDIRRLTTVTDSDTARLNKYLKAWRLLSASNENVL